MFPDNKITMNKIFELIKENSSNEDYVVGDALLKLFPIDFIKPSELGGASVRICCEESAQLDYDIINAIKGVEKTRHWRCKVL